MKVKLSCTILTLFVYTCLVECKRTKRNWEGVLAFTEDFDGFEIKQDSWTFADWCHGKGKQDTNLECFSKSDDNVRLSNGSLVITAIFRPLTEMKLFGKSKNFTSARIQTNGKGFSHGTFLVSARLPKGKSLAPSITLLPAYDVLASYANCKYEEIEIVSARGEKSSNLIFSASFGKHWNSVVSKRVEKRFPGVDFSKDFHEFALEWTKFPRPRLEWYVDGISIFTASTHFYSDWILTDESNKPCSQDKSLFQQPLQLTISLSVGSSGVFTDQRHNDNSPLTVDEAWNWEKPTFEIDFVKVYQIENHYK